MRYLQRLHELKLFGVFTLLSLSTHAHEAEDEAVEEEPTGIGAGSSHNFTLATNDELDEIPSEPWEEDRFGFRGPR